jgi:NADH-quinone oxidoreductase subunit M
MRIKLKLIKQKSFFLKQYVLSLKTILKTIIKGVRLKNNDIEIKTTSNNFGTLLYTVPLLPPISLPLLPSTPLPDPPILLVMIGTLIVFTVLISLVPEEDESNIRMLALIGSIGFFLMCVDTWWFFDPLDTDLQLAFEIPIIPEYNFFLTCGIDGITLPFILLIAFVIPICLSGPGTIFVNFKQFTLLVLIIEIFLILCICTNNLLCFYIFFECVLIPMYILIGVWGGRDRKKKASFYFFLYTLFGSFFLLWGIVYIGTTVGSFDYPILSMYIANANLEEHNKLIWLCFFIPFAIKIPMFPFHLWLPEAHVEAPTIGSVILASLLLKLGGYGLIRFTLPLFPLGSVYFQPFVVVIAIAGVIYGAFSAIRQTDLKRIIAYSSIAHMNLAVLGLFSFTHQGIDGAIYLMVGHGIVSAALFLCVGNISDRYHTRSLKYFSGLVKVMPLFSGILFLFTLANMSFPGTSNFVGEFLIFVAMYEHNIWMALFAATGIVFSAVYSIWLFNRISFGTLKTTTNASHYADLNRSEFYMFLMLLIPMLLLGVYSGCITTVTSLPVNAIVELYT